MALSPKNRFRSPSGLSLIEVLVVLVILLMVMALMVPAVGSLRRDQEVTRAVYEVAGLLEEARSYAMANSTFVWVGFYEEDGGGASRDPAETGNGGRIVISVVASRDGTRYPDTPVDEHTPAAFGAGDASNPVHLVPVYRLVKLDHVRMLANTAGSAALPSRPAVAREYQVGDEPGVAPRNATGPFAIPRGNPTNPATFSYPLEAPAPQYVFSKIIEFNSRGEASKILENVFTGPGPQETMEIALAPARDGVVEPAFIAGGKAYAVVQVEGLTGQVRVYHL